ncbi:MAG: O-antigen ligase family protein [Coraliomargaritaceae bacterium]
MTRTPIPLKNAHSQKGLQKAKTSSFRKTRASNESLETALEIKKKPVGLLFLPALLVISVLVYFGGIESPWISAFTVISSGAYLIYCPPQYSLGRTIHIGLAIVLGGAFLSFLPSFYWPQPDWRIIANKELSMDLPLLLSIQPFKSWEYFVLLVAGLSWFYVLATSFVNRLGWRWFFGVLSLTMLSFSLLVILGTLFEWQISGLDVSQGFRFFAEREITANFLALGGFACACFGLRGIGKRHTLNLLSLLVSIVCLAALFIGQMNTGLLLFFFGLFVWFLSSVIRIPRKELTKYVLPLVLISLLLWFVLPEGILGYLAGFVVETSQSGVGSRVPVYLDCFELIAESPLAGIGLGNFSEVFPQYRIFSQSPSIVDYPKSDLLWFVAEGGLISFLGIVVCSYGYLRISRERKASSYRCFRRIVFLGVALFFIHASVATPAHHTGPLYLALVFAALAIPNESLKKNSLPLYWWRLVGVALILNGMYWVAGHALGVGVHSLTVRQLAEEQMNSGVSVGLTKGDDDFALNQALRRNPMDWRFYYERGKWALSVHEDFDLAKSDFERAAFCQPLLSEVRFVEGLEWIQYDPSQTSAAWLSALHRFSNDRNALFQRMLAGAQSYPLMIDRMRRLSYLNTTYRREYLLSKEGTSLLKELANDFSEYPSLSNFSIEDRSIIISHWLQYAEVEDVGLYMDRYGEDLKDRWYIDAQFFSRKADFSAAVELVVQNIEPLEIKVDGTTEKDLSGLKRSYAVLPGDLSRGLELLGVYLATGELESALQLIESLLETGTDASEIYYWRAEVLRRLGDFSESWYAFVDYLNRSIDSRLAKKSD